MAAAPLCGIADGDWNGDHLSQELGERGAELVGLPPPQRRLGDVGPNALFIALWWRMIHVSKGERTRARRGRFTQKLPHLGQSESRVTRDLRLREHGKLRALAAVVP